MKKTIVHILVLGAFSISFFAFGQKSNPSELHGLDVVDNLNPTVLEMTELVNRGVEIPSQMGVHPSAPDMVTVFGLFDHHRLVVMTNKDGKPSGYWSYFFGISEFPWDFRFINDSTLEGVTSGGGINYRYQFGVRDSLPGIHLLLRTPYYSDPHISNTITVNGERLFFASTTTLPDTASNGMIYYPIDFYLMDSNNVNRKGLFTTRLNDPNALQLTPENTMCFTLFDTLIQDGQLDYDHRNGMNYAIGPNGDTVFLSSALVGGNAVHRQVLNAGTSAWQHFSLAGHGVASNNVSWINDSSDYTRYISTHALDIDKKLFRTTGVLEFVTLVNGNGQTDSTSHVAIFRLDMDNATVEVVRRIMPPVNGVFSPRMGSARFVFDPVTGERNVLVNWGSGPGLDWSITNNLGGYGQVDRLNDLFVPQIFLVGENDSLKIGIYSPDLWAVANPLIGSPNVYSANARFAATAIPFFNAITLKPDVLCNIETGVATIHNDNHLDTSDVRTQVVNLNNTTSLTDSSYWIVSGVYDTSEEGFYFSFLKPSDFCATSLPIDTSDTTSVAFHEKHRNIFYIYSNPTTHNLHVHGENLERVSIFNMSGQLIISQQFDQNIVIDVSLLAQGIYIVQGKDFDGSVSSKKFIKE